MKENLRYLSDRKLKVFFANRPAVNIKDLFLLNWIHTLWKLDVHDGIKKARNSEYLSTYKTYIFLLNFIKSLMTI